MSTIRTETSQTALWHELVREAQARGGLELGADLESYLVFVLMRHLRDAQLDRHLFALDLLEALARRGRDRADALRDTGDRCLLIAGLYPEQAERRLVSLDYFLTFGAHAYAELADGLQAALAALYRELARAFARLVRVLIELRRQARAGRVPDSRLLENLRLAEVRATGYAANVAASLPFGTVH